MSYEVKVAKNPEGMHVDIQDLIFHLEQEAIAREENIRKGLFHPEQNEFFRGEVYGYRRIAEQFKEILNKEG